MEINTKSGLREYLSPFYIMNYIAFSMTFYHLYKAYFGVYQVWRHRGIHLVFILLLAFFKKGLTIRDRSKLLKFYDLILIVLSILLGVNIVMNYLEIQLRGGIPNLLDLVSFIVVVYLIIDASYRTIGLPLTIITLTFLAYVLFGSHLPGDISHPGYSFMRLVDIFWNSTEGIMGVPTGVSAV